VAHASDGRRRARRATTPARAWSWLLAPVGVALVLAGCGGGEEEPRVLPAGQIDVQAPRSDSGRGAAAGRSTASTIPLDRREDPTTALFAALAKFRSCLDGLGVTFIGAPEASNPSSPTNDPKYIEALTTCAARSNVVQALQTAQSANEGLSPAELELRNKAYLRWRTCMIERSWEVPAPVPDAQGRLFRLGTDSGGQITGPPGKNLLTSNDIEECADRAQRQVGLRRGSSSQSSTSSK